MNKKILIIDDEEIIIKTLAILLKRNGYEVDVIKRGQDALIMVEEEEYNLIITDIRMPGMNGIKTIEEINKILEEKGTGLVPYIFITGFADEVEENEAMKLKPIAYILKPFDNHVLLSKIKEVM